MLANQKHRFNLSEEAIYLNGAYMAPQLRSVEQIGIESLRKKASPFFISESDFFSEKIVLKQRFAQLIEAPDPECIAIIPSVSYGIATVIKNIEFKKGDEVVVLEEQFPSNYYAWKQLETEKEVVLKIIKAPKLEVGRAERWNEALLEAISSKTKVVAIPNIHWADGTLFNLKLIRKRTVEEGAYLIIDGTQSVGALPFSIAEIQPDALICGGYKWLLGAYGLGLAYYGEKFHHGNPLENNWMNHEGSENFSNLVNYNENFKPKATRFDVGESSNFILTPMLSEAIRQLLEWTPAAIQEYCKNLTQDFLKQLPKNEYYVEDPKFRAHHLFGIYSTQGKTIAALKEEISAKKIVVSYRGNAIRVSPNVYNSPEEVEKLISCFIS
ncbi:selenocysteine lyase/cysteine desulfurase [Ulvibacter sp. MAR_2010_11]|uniref:aminotransferase class V-fold PLP-dependent enzyme n=1 Tax=Ulvibacter sp. MAR_2010_11 TaxID=1250229 RepID=UPI000C2C4BD0|nr:aminotransferase class V-fold PLP-dependent enzyme [Ulvibacter sp. MAR_2010_11]PKA83080.1 selenocysteine lyase/cysteine desulfurase [Ulvibacter sp. MAR_2010_11]